jgi:hypothetical protein
MVETSQRSTEYKNVRRVRPQTAGSAPIAWLAAKAWQTDTSALLGEASSVGAFETTAKRAFEGKLGSCLSEKRNLFAIV